MPFRWAALRGRYYVHLVQMHGPFPNLVRVGVPLFAGLSATARRTTRATGRPSERDTHFDNETTNGLGVHVVAHVLQRAPRHLRTPTSTQRFED